MRARLPLRLRLTLAFAAGMAIVLAALGAFLYARLGSELLGAIDLDLRSRAALITSALGEQSPGLLESGQKLIDPDEAFAQVLDPEGRIVDSSQAVAAAPMLTPAQVRAISGATFLTRHVTGIDDPARLLAVPARVGAGRVVVVVGAPLGDRAEALARLLLLLTIGGPIALIVSSAAGWALAGAALRPVERIRKEAAAISESEPNRRLPVPETRDELARLANTLNEMLGRLQEALEREHRLVDEASHELRTPLAVLKGELDLALTRPRTTAELEKTVRAAKAETDRLVRLSEDLLVLARTRGGRLPLRREQVSLRGLLVETAARLETPARDAGTRIEVEAPDERVSVDPVRIRQAVQNLLDNAIRHARGNGPIRVVGERTDGEVRIAVEDGGPGFSPGLLARAFEPFRQGSPPRDGDASTGLGLTIVQAVAEAHGGHAEASNPDGGGARVVLVVRA